MKDKLIESGSICNINASAHRILNPIDFTHTKFY